MTYTLLSIHDNKPIELVTNLGPLQAMALIKTLRAKVRDREYELKIKSKV